MAFDVYVDFAAELERAAFDPDVSAELRKPYWVNGRPAPGPRLGDLWWAPDWRMAAPERLGRLLPPAGVDAVLPPFPGFEVWEEPAGVPPVDVTASGREVTVAGLLGVKSIAALELAARSHDRWAGRAATPARESARSRAAAEGYRQQATAVAADVVDLGTAWRVEVEKSIKRAPVVSHDGKW